MEISEESKRIAIEFAKKMLGSQIYKCDSGKVGEKVDYKIVDVSEFKIILGELILNGDKLFDEFIENYKQR